MVASKLLTLLGERLVFLCGKDVSTMAGYARGIFYIRRESTHLSEQRMLREWAGVSSGCSEGLWLAEAGTRKRPLFGARL